MSQSAGYVDEPLTQYLHGTFVISHSCTELGRQVWRSPNEVHQQRSTSLPSFCTRIDLNVKSTITHAFAIFGLGTDLVNRRSIQITAYTRRSLQGILCQTN